MPPARSAIAPLAVLATLLASQAAYATGRGHDDERGIDGASDVALDVGTATDEGLAFDDDVDAWVEGRIASMSLREKLGQMVMIDLKSDQFAPQVARHLEAGEFGGVIFFERNLKDADQTRLLVKQLQTHAIVRRGVPLLVAVDQEGGLVNRLGNITQFKSMRHSARTLGNVYQYAPQRAAKLVNQATTDIARWMRDLGFNMNLAPVLDVTDDKTSYIYDRSYSGDPERVSRVARQYAETMRKNGIITTGKHFPNLSLTRADSHKTLPVLDRKLEELKKREFVPFARLKDELGAIMVGHVMVPAIDAVAPASVSARITRILREDIGYDGVLISDDLKMKALSDRYTLPDIILRSVQADIDILIMAWDPDKQLTAVDVLEKAVRRGQVKPSRIDASLRRILALKSRFAR